MAVIVVFGGTSEGRLLAEALRGAQVEAHICVATEYGASLIPHGSHVQVHTGRMQEEQMEQFLTELVPEYCFDATHPYASDVTENIIRACRSREIPYIRVLREEVASDEKEVGIVYLESAEEAVEYLNHTNGNILLTVGSKELEKYTAIENYRERCFARVLPTLSVVEKCRELGFEGKNLIGMQGPFSEELNYGMLKQIQALYLVTKNSGKEGGYPEKYEAAFRAGATVLVIGKKTEPAVREGCQIMSLPEVTAWVEEQYGQEQKRCVYLIGMGPGDAGQLTAEAVECLKSSDVVLGAERMLRICKTVTEKPSYTCYKIEQISELLKEHPQYRKVALVYSGDIGFYSGAKGAQELLQEYEVHPVSGISSAIYFLNKLLIPWDEVTFVSCHGKQCQLIPLIRSKKWVCTLLGKKEDFWQICGELSEFGMKDIRITVGEYLSYPKERVLTGTPEELREEEIDALSVALFENPQPEKERAVFEIADEAFIRGKVPMTKREIRTLSLAKLGLTRDAVMYDIGAGTGSVAIEAALYCDRGQVYAVEKKAEGVHLLQENKRKFCAANLTVVEGTAPDCLAELPAPTHVFIGGSGGKLLEIVRIIREKNRQVRFVVNAITLETLAQLERLRQEFPEYRNAEVVQVSVSRERKLGEYHMLEAQNPVYIISFGDVQEE